MRTYVMYELLGTLWWLGAFIGATEHVDKVTAVGIIVGTSYFLRAVMTYKLRKE